MKAWREKSHFVRNNAQFPFLGLARVPLNPNNVPTAKLAVDVHIVFLRLVVSENVKLVREVSRKGT